MSDNELSKLFPLEVTPFEHYMLVDDRPDYPMTFVCKWQYRGELDNKAFEAATEEARRRHPLLSSLIEYPKFGKPCWKLTSQKAPEILRLSKDDRLQEIGTDFLDLTKEIGFRIWIQEDDGTGTIFMQFHHACCDGIGSLQFSGDLFASYGKRTASDGSRPQLAEVDLKLLLNRGHFQIKRPHPVSVFSSIVGFSRETVRTLSRRPRPVYSPSETKINKSEKPFPALIHETIEEAEYRRLRKLAQAKKSTLNDLLLRDLFLAIKQWDKKHGIEQPNAWKRITMPTNLREKTDESMPAANKIGYAFITRRTIECHDKENLLTGIQQDTKSIRQWKLGAMFDNALRIALKIPGGLRNITSGRSCFSTAILSNLGEPTRRFTAKFPRCDGKIQCGDIQIDNIVAAPPTRPHLFVSLVIAAYASRLNICLRADPNFFNDSDSREFLGLYTAIIHKNLED